MFRNFYMLMDKAGEGDSGGQTEGGQGEGSQANGGLFDGPESGDSNTNAKESKGSEGAQNTGGNSSEGQKISIPENWKESLPDEIKQAPYMQNVDSVETLAKNYANAQKIIGADKMAVPNKNWSNEEWRQAFKKMGLPETKDEYKLVDDPKNFTHVDAKFLDSFQEKAFERGILPSQAKELLQWFNDYEKAETDSYIENTTQEQQKGINALRNEWGEAYESNLSKAKAALKEFASDEDKEKIKQLGLGNSAFFIKLLSSAGSLLSEDKIIGHSTGMDPKYTPEMAQREIDQIMSNKEHPYWNSEHGEHSSAKDHMERLFKAKTGKKT